MKLKIIILYLFIICLTSAQTVYEIPVGSKNNTIIFSIKNIEIKPVENLRITKISQPDWLTFNSEEYFIDKVSNDNNPEVNFNFDIKSSAPPNEVSYVTFRLEDKSDRSWNKIINLKVIPPSKYELLQNYPNPFNPTTKITYSVPVDGLVTISVYNMLGEKVKDLINKIQKPGMYEITFDAKNLSSGIYIYRMQAGEFVSIKKMLVLK